MVAKFQLSDRRISELMNESNSDTNPLIAISKPAARVVVRFRSQTIADSENALVLEEPGYPPVYYVPRRDVDLSALERSTTVTFCPRKGDATHYSLAADCRQSIDAAWTYEEPLPEVEAIVDHIAFYEERVDELCVNVSNPL